MELNKVHNIDVLDGLGRLPDGSVNLVLTDPPYNIGKAAWDTIDNYVEWCGKWLKECERILKPNGILVFWHNDFVQTSQLVTWINNNTRMSFNSCALITTCPFACSYRRPPSDTTTGCTLTTLASCTCRGASGTWSSSASQNTCSHDFSLILSPPSTRYQLATRSRFY